MALADEDVDVALLDQWMPGLSGDEVLERLHERGHDCQVAMVTGVTPDLDLVDMPIDEYLTKPIRKETLEGTVRELLLRAGRRSASSNCWRSSPASGRSTGRT
jgi:DNA-binding response OmpR family regulator